MYIDTDKTDDGDSKNEDMHTVILATVVPACIGIGEMYSTR